MRPAAALIDERKGLGGLGLEAIIKLPLRNALDVTSARQLADFVRHHQIQIVHAHMARDYPLAAYAASRAGARAIVTRHVLFPLNRLHALTLRRVSRVIAVSDAVAHSLTHRGLALDRTVVIENGIDVNRFRDGDRRSDREQFFHRWELSRDQVICGTVGELLPLKGHEDFVRAAAIVSRRFPQAQFFIAGVDGSPDGACRAGLERLIDELALSEKTRLIGWVENLPQFYRALNVFVSASHTESFGLAIVEAMAAGTPVVATRTEGAMMTIADQSSGLLVPIGDTAALAAAMETMLADQVKATAMALEAQQIAAVRYSLERMVAETVGLYQEVLEQKSSAPAPAPKH